MKKIIIRTLLGTFSFLNLYSSSLGMDQPPDPIKTQGDLRSRYFWQPLESQEHELSIGATINLGKMLYINDRCNSLKSAIYRSCPQSARLQDQPSAIPYIVCMSQDVKQWRTPPQGVIVNVYGGGIPLSLKKDDSLEEAKLWAAQDYIVYLLNLRGTTGYGEDFLHSPERSLAVQSMVRDISYFVYLIKSRRRDHRGHTPIGWRWTQKTTPFYLTGTSFGGYLTLCHATNSEDHFLIHPYGVRISHRTLFDGYIAVNSPTDIWRDVKSGTRDGKTRLPFFTQGKSSIWMQNAYQNKNVVDNVWHNRELSPLYRMGYLRRPTLFIHGLKDTNVTPKQTIDCVKQALLHDKKDLVFLYYDSTLGHNYPNATMQFKGYYDSIFQFMDGVAFATHNGKHLITKDSRDVINSVAYIKMRALNPDVSRPIYQFLYEACTFFHEGDFTHKSFDQFWLITKNIKTDFFLKALIWMKEKEKITFTRDLKRTYLDQKNQMVSAYKAKLHQLHIRDYRCGKIPGISLKEYYEKRTRLHGHRLITNYDRLISYLGDGFYKGGIKKLFVFEERLKRNLKKIIEFHPLDLLVHSPILATRFEIT